MLYKANGNIFKFFTECRSADLPSSEESGLYNLAAIGELLESWESLLTINEDGKVVDNQIWRLQGIRSSGKLGTKRFLIVLQCVTSLNGCV
jgi:hypothetical protein